MIDASQFKAPGQLIQALLDERDWSQRVLAVVLNASETGINKIITGKQPLTAEMALSLAVIFNIRAETFLELQKKYELAQARLLSLDDPALSNRAHLFGSLPISDMVKRGWLAVNDLKDFSKVESEISKFFGVNTLTEIEIFPHAAKKTNVSREATPVQLAWLYRVKEIASEMLVARYSNEAVREAIPKLKELLASPVAIRKVPRILAECGIRYLIVESLPGSKIDGVCFWLNDTSPVIGMSLQRDRIDNFWFVLRHEMEHVIQLHGKSLVMLDAELEGDSAGTGPNVTDEERVANQAAADFCVPKRSIESFIARKGPLFYERDIIGFANTLHIHPGLVAGQLQHRTNRYDRFRDHLVKIRAFIAPSAMVDGWGDEFCNFRPLVLGQ